MLNLQSVTPDTLKLSIVKHRLQGSRPNIYMRKAGDDGFEVCGTDKAKENESYSVQNGIIELLSASNESLQTREIIVEMQYQHKVGKRAVERALQELYEAGKVVKVRRGYYMLADEDEPPLPPGYRVGGNGGNSINFFLIIVK